MQFSMVSARPGSRRRTTGYASPADTRRARGWWDWILDGSRTTSPPWPGTDPASRNCQTPNIRGPHRRSTPPSKPSPVTPTSMLRPITDVAQAAGRRPSPARRRPASPPCPSTGSGSRPRPPVVPSGGRGVHSAPLARSASATSGRRGEPPDGEPTYLQTGEHSIRARCEPAGQPPER